MSTVCDKYIKKLIGDYQKVTVFFNEKGQPERTEPDYDVRLLKKL